MPVIMVRPMMARWHEQLFPVLEELSIGFVAFSPLANGFLSGQYGKETKFQSGSDYRSIMPQFTSEAVEQNQALLTLLQNTAASHGATKAQISLAWMLGNLAMFLVPIPGTRNMARLQGNAGAAEIILTKAEVQALDDELMRMEISPVFGGTKVIDKA